MNPQPILILLGIGTGLLLVWHGPLAALVAGAALWAAVLAFGRLPLLLFRARSLTRPQRPELHRALDTLCTRAALPRPRLFLIPSPTPNAMLCGGPVGPQALAVTSGLLELLDPKEIQAVLAHELGHLAQRRQGWTPPLPAAPLLAGLTRSALLKSAGEGLFRRNSAQALSVVHAWLHRRGDSGNRELAADLYAARLCDTPLWLASALRKIHVHHQGPESHPGAAHPPVAQRIARLEAMAYGAYLG